MRVMLASDLRFVRTPDGNIYTQSTMHYKFLRRYLTVFDEVVVLARLKDVANPDSSKLVRANGASVRFYPVPYYVGSWQCLRRYFHVAAVVRKAVEQADAFILRGPGTIGSVLWHNLKKNEIPYGVEVITDPWDVFAPGNIKTLLRPFIRRIMSRKLVKQCRFASASAYITEFALQKRYPPCGWSTYYSSVDLPDEAIIDNDGLLERFASLNDAVAGRRPFKICHAGSMSTLYKGQHILLEAIAICREKGLDIHLVLLGDGKYRQYFAEKAEALGISQGVKFLGQLPPGEQVRGQIDASDLFVLPSLAEGQGRVLIEAMARAAPCIGSNIGGIPELLDAEDLVPPGDARALARKIEEVLSDRSRMEKMAQRNLKSAPKYRNSELDLRRKTFYKKLAEITGKWRGKN